MRLHTSATLLSLSFAASLLVLGLLTDLASSAPTKAAIAVHSPSISPTRSSPSSSSSSSSSSHPGSNKISSSNRKKPVVVPTVKRKKSVQRSSQPFEPEAAAPSSTTTKTKATNRSTNSTASLSPLLLHPLPHTVWLAGSSQLVKWSSKKYASSLPKETTVDVVLLDPKTNKKLVSLKRFIPFKKAKVQVTVPTAMAGPHVLALELFLGHSQLEVTVGVEIGEKGKEKRAKEEKPPASETRADLFSPSSSSLSGSTSSSSIMRRADIHISHAQPKVERGVIVPPSNPGTLTDNTNNDSETKRKTTNQNASPPSTTTVTAPTTAMFQQQSLSGTPVDINGDDYYVGSTLSRSLEFLPQEMRQEYPSVILPLELEHTLGLYQKVYLLTPYTLEWRIPDRVLELLEYSESRLRLIKRSQSQVLEPDQVRLVRETLRRNTKTYLAKLSIELVNHDTLETVSVLAKNVPAETRFQYLQILDRVELDQYRLRVQMVVVELEDHHVAGGQEEDNDETGLHSAASRIRSTHGDHTEGWDFPPGGKVVDRYESITRRFWVSAGAF